MNLQVYISSKALATNRIFSTGISHFIKLLNLGNFSYVVSLRTLLSRDSLRSEVELQFGVGGVSVRSRGSFISGSSVVVKVS